MRLKKEQVERIARKIVNRLQEDGLATFKGGAKAVEEEIISIFTRNLMEEDEIEVLAEQMMDKVRSKVESGEVDGHTFFLMLKKQIAKERRFIL